MLGPEGIVIAFTGNTLFTFDLLDNSPGGKSDNLVEGRGECPHLMDQWSAKDHIVD